MERLPVVRLAPAEAQVASVARWQQTTLVATRPLELTVTPMTSPVNFAGMPPAAVARAGVLPPARLADFSPETVAALLWLELRLKSPTRGQAVALVATAVRPVVLVHLES